MKGITRVWKKTMPDIISSRVKQIDNTTSLNDLIGRKVFSRSGEYVGKVKDFLTRENELLGMLVKGTQTVFIDKEHFTLTSGDMIMLAIEPVTNTIGKQVIDSDGRILGKVVALERKSLQNTYSALTVKRHMYAKPMSIPKAQVSVAKKNVILKIAYQEQENG